jgi:serine/threonine-protein kinase
MLVHRGIVPADVARRAIASAAPRRFLIEHGICSEAQWQQWQRTDGGTRPVLTRYDVGEELGEGGVGRVFAATDKVDGRRLALKVLRAELASDPVQAERFVREAKLLQDLAHPHLVKGYRVAREGETIFCAMELLPGRCLQAVLADHGRLDEEQALQVVLDVASALDALHARGLVHRDVKSGNVMWSPERGAVLIDLGFALGAAGGGGAGGGGGGATTAGTVHYIAPEQARGSDQLDVRADIYALGATLYHLATGSLPFEGHSSEEVLAKQVLESLSGEHIRALQLSPQLHYFLEKMMQKEPGMRFQDPKQLQEEIRSYLQHRQHQLALEQREQQGPRRLGTRRPDPRRRR